ncbi:MAG: NAD(P)-binding protein [Azospirillaceae bacterium]|nr:NAD(P)-binding protein [Azospirillaceae bacterium]
MADTDRLGLTAPITRRDMLNGVLLGSGAALGAAACPAHALAAGQGADGLDPFTGYGGVGDYALSNGNTAAVMNAAHRVRDGAYQALGDGPAAGPVDEDYDLVIVGGGLSGLMAAYEYAKGTGGRRRCLILENHPVFGGAAKQNEFLVNGVRLIGPQASNDFLPPEPGSGTQVDQVFAELDIPRTYTFKDWDPKLTPLRFALDNYDNMDGMAEGTVDVAYHFDPSTGAKQPYWVRNIWEDALARTPYGADVRRQLLQWRATTGETGDEDPRLLDTMTYKHYLEQVKGYAPAVTRFAQPVVGLLGGVGADAVSARVGHHYVTEGRGKPTPSFPGGNSMLSRYLTRALIPDALGAGPTGGQAGFNAVANGRVRFDALDRQGQPTRIRLRATAVRVEHQNRDANSGAVLVTYERDRDLKRVRAKAVIMASGGWVTRRVVADLPDDIRAAYAQFIHAPALVANVALTNWRFLYRLGATAARWIDDGTMFGFCANIRRPMVVGDYDPPLHPDRPTLLTFYMGLYTPGHDAATQASLGRGRLLATSYADYERIIRSQMADMFTGSGFDPRRDIAGIILNRWGHARVVQPPGFYYGVDGRPSPREVVAKGFGRIAIAHAELNGAQNYTGAFQHGKRAAQQILALGV